MPGDGPKGIEVEAISSNFVPAFRAGVSMIPVGDEAVILDESTGDMHQLDFTGTIVCSLFDGARSIQGMVGILAELFIADSEVVERDVVAMVQSLGRQRLLDGVAGG
jgi:hypothetical protein